jgi:hypothetical protein
MWEPFRFSPSRWYVKSNSLASFSEIGKSKGRTEGITFGVSYHIHVLLRAGSLGGIEPVV